MQYDDHDTYRNMFTVGRAYAKNKRNESNLYEECVRWFVKAE